MSTASVRTGPCIWGGVNPCGAPGRLYLSGWFCDPHAPWALRARRQTAVRRLARGPASQEQEAA
jgi:hypothetical protein